MDWAVVIENKLKCIIKQFNCMYRFSSALQMEVDIGEALEKKEFDSALEIFTKTQTKFQELKNEEAVMR